jgi:transitional endoplasmic reticulum ATPase
MAQRQDIVRVRVGAAGLDDVGGSRARLSRTVLATLGVKEGAAVRLAAGSRSVLLHAYAAGEEDDGLNLVRLDGTQRRRLGVEVGASVVVQRHDGRTAARVELVAVGDLTDIDLPLDEVRDALAERPVVVGDTIRITPTRKTFDAQVNLLGLTLAGVTGSVADAEGVLLRVSGTTPAGVVTVDKDTQIEVLHAEGADSDDDEARA